MYETIEKNGKRFVLIPETTYQQMQEAMEALEDIRAFDQARSAPLEFVPAAVADRLIDGDTPLRVWREYRGLSQDQLAEAAGISAPFLSQIEHGQRNPSLDTLKRIAQVLSVDLDDLI